MRILIIDNFAGGDGMTFGKAYRKSVVMTVIGLFLAPSRSNLRRTAEHTKLSSSLADILICAERYRRNAEGDICPFTTVVSGKNTPGALSSTKVTSNVPSALTDAGSFDFIVNLIIRGRSRVNLGKSALRMRRAS